MECPQQSSYFQLSHDPPGFIGQAKATARECLQLTILLLLVLAPLSLLFAAAWICRTLKREMIIALYYSQNRVDYWKETNGE
jgi:hypothetical protein